MSIASRIAQLPGLLGIKNSEFAKALGISHQRFNQYEKKPETGVRYETISAIVEHYPVSEDWLRNGEGDWRKIESVVSEPTAMYTRQDFNMLDVLDRLSGVERRVSALEKKINNNNDDKT